MNRFPWLFILVLASCAHPVREAQQQVARGEVDEGLGKLETLAKAKPDDVEAQSALALAREQASSEALIRGDRLRREGQFEKARAAYQEVLAIFPHNLRAKAGLDAIDAAKKHEKLLTEAKNLVASKKFDEAKEKLRAILAESPEHAEARALMAMVEAETSRPAAKLGDNYQKTVSLEFRDAPLSQVLNVLSRQTGLNFVLDKDTRTDGKVTLYARQVSASEAMNLILSTQMLDKKILNENTLLIYPRMPNKIKDYEELIVRSFYIANADVKNVATLLRGVLKVRDMYIDEKLNLIIARDTPEVLQLAEKIIATQDMPEPEVTLDVEVMEVKRSRLMELGILYPSSVKASLAPAGGTSSGTSATPLTVQDLKNISARDVTLSGISATLNLLKTDGDVKLLSNPRIRVKNREKAKIHIGDRVPVITTTSTANVGVSESVSYLDVGLKLDVEPNVYLDDEVGIKVGLEVSNIVREITTANGALTYQIGTRTAATVLRLKDGETQILAGLISDEDRSTANKLPGLGDVPLLGRLFSNRRDDKTQTEIVLLITPHIVRNLPRLPLQATEFYAGTDSNLGAPSLQLRSPIGPGGFAPPTFPPQPPQIPTPPAEIFTPPPAQENPPVTPPPGVNTFPPNVPGQIPGLPPGVFPPPGTPEPLPTAPGADEVNGNPPPMPELPPLPQ